MPSPENVATPASPDPLSLTMLTRFGDDDGAVATGVQHG